MSSLANTAPQPADIKTILHQTNPFSSLSSRELTMLLPFCHLRIFRSGETITRKGDPARNIFILTNGKARSMEGEIFTPFSCIAGYTIISDKIYYETIIAQEETQAVCISTKQVSSLLQKTPNLQLKLIGNTISSNTLSEKQNPMLFRNILKNLFSEMNYRIKISIFAIYSLGLMSLYNLLTEVFSKYKKVAMDSAIISAIEIIFFASIFFIMILQLKIPLSNFGFNLHRWRQYTLESLLWTTAFCVALLATKMLLIDYLPFLHNQPLINNPLTITKSELLFIFCYVLLAPVQEFVIQGAIQSSLMKLLKVSNAAIVSALLATIIFAALHIDLHFVFAVSILPANLLWALMYVRQRSLLGVSISHALIGVWAFYFLGFHVIFMNVDHMLFK